MLQEDSKLTIRHITEENAKEFLYNHNPTSIVGHQDTASLYSNILKQKIDFNRQSINLYIGDMILIGQYTGPRLPEGTTTLPPNASIKWLVVTIESYFNRD